jgi:hypothetical protein
VSALARLGELSKAYESATIEYEQLAHDAAVAEATHKAARAKAILRFKASETERISHAEAETRAEADDEIAGLYRDRLIKVAKADAQRETLRRLREQVATGRTFAASDRANDQFQAVHGGTP